MSNPSITADKTPWYQWDTGLTVTLSGGEMTECHFANRKQGTAYVQAVINGVARVPDELLQVAAPIKAYGYVSDGAGGQTYVEQSFEVIARNIPADYTYTKTAQKTIRDAEVARDQAVQAAKDAKASELAADDSAVEASNSAQSAGESASAAATSASNAAKSAGDAAKSASDAKAAASKTVEDASELLKTYTDNAKTSADNAATSASNAADAASAASGSASAAAQSATDASNAKAAAQTAKAGAEAAKGEAATSASNAAESATAAAKSASDAAASVGAINVIAPKSVEVAALSEVDGSVAVGAGSVAKKSNELSIGNDTLTREITHVSKPTAYTSAATKSYVDANTSNALVGTASGKLLHVEDAWPCKPLRLTIDGAYKQDGTPSPEAPVPIVVIENPVLKVMGRNLVNVPEMTVEADSNGVTVACGLIPSGTEAFLSFVSSNDADTLNPSGAAFGLYDNTKELSSYTLYPSSIKAGINRASLTPNFDATYHFRAYGYRRPSVSFDMRNYQLEIGGYHDYRPYTSVSLPITLPAEHPYLAALPDGTHDEIMIDKYGNASLIARVQKVDVSNLPAPSASDALGNGLTRYQYWSVIDPPARNDSASVAPAFKNVIDFEFPQQGMYVSSVSIIVGASADPTDALKAGGYIYTTLATPVTYQLGKLDIPSLPETISNVWTDAELTTNMSMTYKRDINVAFDNLVQAVVASAAGE